MATKKTDRDAVIDAALSLFRTQGYHHTSVADISAACGLLKGSIYHYFPGKKELAIAALERVTGEVREKLFRYAREDGRPAAERLRALSEAVERFFIDRDGGCLMGNLALEIGHSIPEFAAAIRAYFDEWRRVLAGLLADRYEPARAAELADDAIARLQGAVMLMGIYRDPLFLRRAARDTAALLAPEKAEAA